MSTQKVAFLLGVAKFAQENNIDPAAFMKVAALGNLYKEANWASSLFNRGANFARKIKNTAVDAFSPTAARKAVHNNINDLTENVRRKTLQSENDAALAAFKNRNIQGATEPKPLADSWSSRAAAEAFRDSAIANQEALTNQHMWTARKNLGKAVGTGAAGLYGAGVAKDYLDMATGSDEYNYQNYDLWDQIMMYLGLKRSPGFFSPLNQFGLFR